ncbi:unnamed protein product [Closterium sp. NIES-53]
MGKVGDASVFRVWGSRALVRDTSAEKLSSRHFPCVFLGFPFDAHGWQFYHPTLRHVLPSQDVTFHESVPFYCLFPYRSAPLPLPPLFLAPRSPQVDPLPGTVPVEVTVDSGAASGAASGGAASGGAKLANAEPGGAESEGAESGCAEPRGIAFAGGLAGASSRLSPRPEPLSPQQLREWFAQRTRLWSGAARAGGSAAGGTGAGAVGATSLGGAGVTIGAGGTGAGSTGAGGAGAGRVGAGDPDAGGARAGGTGAGGAGAGGAGAGDSGAGGLAGARGTGAGGAGAGDPGVGGARAGGTRGGDPGAGGASAGGARASGPGAGGTVLRCPFIVPPPPPSLPPPDSVLCHVLSLPSSTSLPPSLQSPPPHQSQPQVQPDSPLPAPSPYAEQTDSFSERHEPESRPASPVCTVCTGRCVPHPRLPPVAGTHIMAFLSSSVPRRVPLPPPHASSLPAVLDPESDLARASWVDDLATQRSSQGYTFSLGSGSVSCRSTPSSSVLSSSCEAEIYAGAMAALELR